MLPNMCMRKARPRVLLAGGVIAALTIGQLVLLMKLTNERQKVPMEAVDLPWPSAGIQSYMMDNKSKPEFSLKVPFYMYEGDLDWWNATLDGKLVREISWLHRYKHSDDYWMLVAARNHPMRTRDPSKAKLFFVPMLWNLLMMHRTGHICSKPMPRDAQNYSNYCGNVECLEPTDCHSARIDSIQSWVQRVYDSVGHSRHCDSEEGDCLYWFQRVIRSWLRTFHGYLGNFQKCEPKGCYNPPFHTKSRILLHANEVLGRSPWFQRNKGRDHLIVTSFYRPLPVFWDRLPKDAVPTPIELRTTANLPNLHSCNLIIFEGDSRLALPEVRHRGMAQDEVARKRLFDRVAWPGLYLGSPCPRASEKTHDFAFVGSLKPDKSAFRKRYDICQWVHSNMSNYNYSVAACGSGNQCPAVAQAKYGFHIRGDTLSSNRLMDILLSGSVPVCTHPRHYDIVPPWIPWRDMTYFANASSQEAFDESLHDILSRPPQEYQEKLKLIELYRPYLDHKQPYQFDMYMANLGRHLGYQS